MQAAQVGAVVVPGGAGHELRLADQQEYGRPLRATDARERPDRLLLSLPRSDLADEYEREIVWPERQPRAGRAPVDPLRVQVREVERVVDHRQPRRDPIGVERTGDMSRNRDYGRAARRERALQSAGELRRR